MQYLERIHVRRSIGVVGAGAFARCALIGPRGSAATRSLIVVLVAGCNTIARLCAVAGCDTVGALEGAGPIVGEAADDASAVPGADAGVGVAAPTGDDGGMPGADAEAEPCLPAPPPIIGRTWYVSPAGDDTATGATPAEAWRSLGAAVQNSVAVQPGDTIAVLPGLYPENLDVTLQGEPGAPITITAADPADPPVIRGPRHDHQLQVADRSHLRIKHLTFDGFQSAGILVRSIATDIADIVVEGCRITHMDGGPTRNDVGAYAIFAGVKDQAHVARDIVIRDNHLQDITTGSAAGYNECLTIGGNVRGVLVEGNTLINGTFIGINVLGADGEVTIGGSSIDLYYGRPREVIVRDNRIDGIRPNDYGVRTGIYMDRPGGDIVVEGNRIRGASPAIVVASFEPGWDDRIPLSDVGRQFIVRNNVVHGYHGIMVGVGGALTDTGTQHEDADRISEDIAIAHNVVLADGVYAVPLIWAQSRHARVKNNVFVHASSEGPNVFTATGRFAQVDDWLADGNLYHSASGRYLWEFGNTRYYDDLAGYQAGTTQDAHAVIGEPVFTDADAGDYALQAGSPGADGGVPLTNVVAAVAEANVVTVADTRYFTDGYGFIGGDRVVIGSATAAIVAIDRAAGTLTLDHAISAVAQAPVSYRARDAEATLGVYSLPPRPATETCPPTGE